MSLHIVQEYIGCAGDRLVCVAIVQLHVEASDLRIHPDLVTRIGSNKRRTHTLDFLLQIALLDRSFDALQCRCRTFVERYTQAAYAVVDQLVRDLSRMRNPGPGGHTD